MPRFKSPMMILITGLAAMAIGCRDAEVTVQRVRKGSEPIAAPAPAGSTLAPAAVAAATGDLRIWTLPEGWRELENTAPMRLATLQLDDESGPVEVAVTSFPGDVGGGLANVNRWRGQMGVEPIAAGELEAALRRFENVPGYSGYFLRIDGEGRTMLAAGVHGREADRSWFVRTTTAGEVATRIEGAVLAFAMTFGAGEAQLP